MLRPRPRSSGAQLRTCENALTLSCNFDYLDCLTFHLNFTNCAANFIFNSLSNPAIFELVFVMCIGDPNLLDNYNFALLGISRSLPVVYFSDF